MSHALSFTQPTSVRRGRSGVIALWVVQTALAGMFLLAGASKLVGAPAMVTLFTAIGVGQWFRCVTGLTLAAHGAQKWFGWFGGYGLDGTGQFMETLGFHPGRRHAALAGLTEAGGGVLLALGLLTPIGAAFVASVMLVATITVHLKNGF